MIPVRWTPAAVDDLEQIGNYLLEKNPSQAESTVRKIYDVAQSLIAFPNRGRLGRMTHTRELLASPLPFIVVYQVSDQAVIIIRIFHSSENWP